MSRVEKQRQGEAAERGRGQALASRVTEGLGALVSRADKGAGRLKGAARDLRRPAALNHALAARDRGNLEAAFWLWAEAFEERPEDPEVVVGYWDTAVQLRRVDVASPAGVILVQQHAAAGEVDLAAQYWSELVDAAPEVLVAPTALATILPVLRGRLADAREEEEETLRGLMRRAMRHAVDPRNQGLGPGVALRLFEEGREANPEAARRAAEVALDSPHLHEAKRARLEAWLEGGDPDAAAAPSARPASPEASPAREAAPAETPAPSVPTRRQGGSLSDDEIAVAAARLPPPSAADASEPEPEDTASAPDLAADEEEKPDESLADPQQELVVVEAVPVELSDEDLSLVLTDGRRSRVACSEIEALAVVSVAGLAQEPVVVIDLVLNWNRWLDEPLRVVRLREDGFDPAALVPDLSVAGGALPVLLAELLERSHAIPLPDPESALGLRPEPFDSLAAYQRQVLGIG